MGSGDLSGDYAHANVPIVRKEGGLVRFNIRKVVFLLVFLILLLVVRFIWILLELHPTVIYVIDVMLSPLVIIGIGYLVFRLLYQLGLVSNVGERELQESLKENLDLLSILAILVGILVLEYYGYLKPPF